LGSMLITKLYLAAMSRADENALSLAKLPQFYLFVDEFQSFADKSFADILSEARKYKLNLTMAHQYIEQMEEEVRDAVFGNVGTMIVFRVGAYDAEVLEKEFAPTFTAEDLVNLGLRQIYLKLMIDAVTSQPFSATTLPQIGVPQVSYVEKILTNSRETYAHLRSEVEEAITSWHEAGKVMYSSKVETRGAKLPDKKQETSIKTPTPQPIQNENTSSILSDADKSVSQRISLEGLKSKTNNQRKPNAKNVSALREALSKIQDTRNSKQTVVNNSQTLKANEAKKPLDSTRDRPGSSEAKKEPTPEELKKLLGVHE
jgi:hypothetical protein